MTDKLQQEAVARWMPLEGTLLERSAIGWFVRHDDHLADRTKLLDRIAELEKDNALLRSAVIEVLPGIAKNALSGWGEVFARMGMPIPLPEKGGE